MLWLQRSSREGFGSAHALVFEGTAGESGEASLKSWEQQSESKVGKRIVCLQPSEKCGTAQESVQRRRQRALTRMGGFSSTDIFVPLAMAYKETCYIHNIGTTNSPFNPSQMLEGVIPLSFT